MPAPIPSPVPVNAPASADAAASAAGAASDASVSQLFSLPTAWPTLGEAVLWCQEMRPGTAAILLVCGFVFLVYGANFHRALMSLNACVLGAWIGGILGQQAGAAVPGALIGGFLCGLLAWPMIKYAIATVAASVGFIVGCSVWRTFGFDSNYAPAGGIIGTTFLTMLSFITVRSTVILATGIQGAAMLIAGALGMAYKYQSISDQLSSVVLDNRFVLPVAIAVPALIGVLYQHSSGNAQPAKK